MIPGLDSRAAIVFMTAWLLAAGAGAASPPSLHLVDDRGQPVDRPVEACFRVELQTECRPVAAGGTVLLPPSFRSLRIEGEDHGPADLHRAALLEQPDGSLRAAVPRKATLRIESAAPRRQPLTVSLYDPGDPTFREPVFRVRLPADQQEVKVPAGELIASLSMERNAPDLHRLTAKPAERYRIDHRPRQGWSLVARCRSAATLRSVPGVQVQVTEAVGYGQTEKRLTESVSGPDGLVLLSGLKAPMVGLEARHPGFIPSQERGLTASPGTFAFREVDLSTGGRIIAQVTVHGRPQVGATCQVLAPAPDAPDPRNPYRLLWEGPVEDKGICRSGRLAPGEHKLRVRLAASTGGNAQVSRWITVEEGQDAEVDLALAPTRVSGEVRRGGKPAPGYSVEALRIDRDRPGGSRGDLADTAVSDNAGRYELTLWIPGWYTLHLRSASKAPAAGHKELTTEGDEERSVDFDLTGSTFRGTVVDEDGQPVEKARVALRWEGLLVADTDTGGRFEIDVQGEGTGSVHAFKPGYRESETVDVPVVEGTAIPPVTLKLKRKATARGTVVSAGGSPVPGAWIGSGAFLIEEGPSLFSETRSQSGGEFEVEIPPGPPRLFVSGPACPLSWFDLPAAGNPAESPAPPALRCPPLPATLELTLSDAQGRPLPHAGVILRQKGDIVPQGVLARHLQFLGLSPVTDGAGRLILAGLAPGDYDLFLSALSSESTIAGGRMQGYLTTVSLPALQTTDLQVTIPGQR